MIQTSEQLAHFLRRSPVFEPLVFWPQTVPPVYRSPYPSAEQIAGELLTDSEFQALRLATWLRSPDGELIAEAVALVISPPPVPSSS